MAAANAAIVQSYLRPELEYRLRFIIQEAWKFAKQSKRQHLLKSDVDAAYLLLAAGRLAGSPIAHAEESGSSQARLAISDLHTAALPLTASHALLGGTVGNATAAAVSALAHSRESAAILSALSAAIQAAVSGSSSSWHVTSGAGGGQEGVSALLTQLASEDESQVERIMPAVISTIKEAVHSCLLAPGMTGAAGASGGNDEGAIAAEIQAQRRLRRALRVVAGLLTVGLDSTLLGAGELLALVCSVLLVRRTHVEDGRASGVGGTGEAAAAPRSADVSSLLQLQGGDSALLPSSSSSSSSALSTSALSSQPLSITPAPCPPTLAAEVAHTREYAAEVLCALVDRVAGVWPAARVQAAELLLEQAAAVLDFGSQEGDARKEGSGSDAEGHFSGGGGSSGAEMAEENDGAFGGGSVAAAADAGGVEQRTIVSVTSCETLFGAACGLALLRRLPEQQQSAVVELFGPLHAAAVDQRLAGSTMGAANASLSAGADEGAVGLVLQDWREPWASLCEAAMLRALRAQDGASAPAAGLSPFSADVVTFAAS